jgi:CO/xanthine dehydrogenase FAD-binding subunit
MHKFDYLVPKSMDEAISLLESYGESARFIAGGTDILVKIKEGKITPDYLVSLKHIPDLNRLVLDRETGELHIGALVTHRTLETSDMIRRRYPIIHDAVSRIGSVQIRNVATIGGNVVNSVPSADGTIPLVALDAVAVIVGPKGERQEELLYFFLGPGQNTLERGEILARFIVPPLSATTGSAYIKLSRREAMELPILGVGVILSMEADLRTCKKARISLGVAAPTPIRALSAERFLKGKVIDDGILDEAGAIAAEESRVRDSIRGVAWYRREMVQILVRRMGKKCLAQLNN